MLISVVNHTKGKGKLSGEKRDNAAETSIPPTNSDPRPGR
jgi:hypothetical protein